MSSKKDDAGSQFESDPKIVIREANESDYSEITKISIEVWRQAYKGIVDQSFLDCIDFDKWLKGRIQWLREPNRYAIIAVMNNTIVGFCEFGVSEHLEYGQGEIYALYIRPQYQNRGIGVRLMKRAIRRLQDEGFTPYIIIALEKNTVAQKFYEKLGFHVIDKSSHKIGGVEYSTNVYRQRQESQLIRLLTQKDWEAYKQLRLEALKNSPESFGSSYEEELVWSDQDFQTELKNSDIFGVVVDGEIVSCAGFYSLKSNKTAHRGVVWGMYTKPEYRKQGIAGALFNKLIQHAKSRVVQLHLTCVTSNLSAIAFYEKQGFKTYGTEPRSLKIRDEFLDEYLMILDLIQPLLKKN